MERKLVSRGAVAGLVAGLLAFVFGRIFAEPQIHKAVSYETARDSVQQALDRAAGMATQSDPMVFSRTVQSDVGMGLGVVVFGAGIGVLFAVAYTICLGRTGALRPRSLSALLAAAGFLSVYLVPFLKYPASPPAIGHAETIRARTALYLLLVLSSLVLLTAAVWWGQHLRTRYGAWTATLVAGAGFIVAIGALMWVLPAVGELAANRANYGHFATETPQPLRDANGNIVFPGFPADVLYSFRVYSVATQLVLWSALGLIFAPSAERVLDRRSAPAARLNALV